MWAGVQTRNLEPRWKDGDSEAPAEHRSVLFLSPLIHSFCETSNML